MAKTYSGGVIVATGFKLNDPQPIVDYMVVDLYTDLVALPNQFNGMQVFCKADDKTYPKKSTGWAETGGAGGGHIIKDSTDTPLEQKVNLKFIGATVENTTTDTVVTIPTVPPVEPEVYIGTEEPTGEEILWVDTDDNTGGGGGGTTDYDLLTNKPKINSVELSGDKTSAELGLQDSLVSGINIKTINGDSILGEGDIEITGVGAISLTYDELVTLKTDSSLVIGQRYIITDYQTVHEIPNSSIPTWDPINSTNIWSPPAINTGDIEPLMVIAITANGLANECYSTLFPEDIIYYSIENDQAMVPGCTKGYIYRRIDTLLNNDIDLDFRNVRFRIHKEVDSNNYGVAWWVTSEEDGIGVENESFLGYKYTKDFWNGVDITKYVPCNPLIFEDSLMFRSVVNNDYLTSRVSNNKFYGNTTNLIVSRCSVFFNDKNHDNIISNNFKDNTINTSYGFYKNVIADNVYKNIIEGSFTVNTIGDNFYLNIIEGDFQYNRINDNFINNYIATITSGNVIDISFSGNSITCYFTNNTIGISFRNNTIGDNFNDNFTENIIGGGIESIDFTNAFYPYQTYPKEIEMINGSPVLRYYDNDGVLNIVPADSPEITE